ncbi:MAG: N-acetylmuramoyl-L-alanine amidase [Frankiales bacterium]|nr:N-acetylmuramoyl-L-alanine amidase [Frankiales bacterium]
MRRTTLGPALLVAAIVPAVLVAGAAPSVAVRAPVGAAPRTVEAVVRPAAVPAPVVAAAGPTPSSWEGGHAVAVAPRWWPQGYSHASAPWPSAWPRPVAFSPTRKGPLTGLVIALDPGHNIGNRNHVAQLNHTYWVGLTKICNTTGTATNSGYPEATYNWDVIARLRRMLVANGATVVVTRDRNSATTYGPCVSARGSFGQFEKAAFMLSVHADGGPSTGRGFHVIVPAYYKGYTDDIAARSRVLGNDLIAGMSTSFQRTTYLSNVLSVRKDQGTLNMSNVPVAVVETLNMRNRYDARIATSRLGRQQVAHALLVGILRYAKRL